MRNGDEKMKKMILAVALAMSMVITGSLAVYAAVVPGESEIEPMDNTVPRLVYNFQEKPNPYPVDGVSEEGTMFSHYHYTGASSYILVLTNNQDENQKIKLYRSSDDRKIGEFTIPAESTATYYLDTTYMWYMEIYSPLLDFDGVNVTGTITASLT